MLVKDFINNYLNIAILTAMEKGYKPALAFTCISQCALETGWVKSDLMRNNNALFGIKWYQGCKYGYYEAPTKEYVNGQYITVYAKFCKYDNVKDCFEHYYNLVSTGRYKDCIKADTVKECITIIKNGGYATDPNYINSVLAVYDTIMRVLKNG